MRPLGVVRHLAEVEPYWLRVVLLDEQDVSDYYCTTASRTATSRTSPPSAASWPAPGRTRRPGATWTYRYVRRGQPVNLRWILVHLLEEYARHLGHRDLLREAVDGRTGY